MPAPKSTAELPFYPVSDVEGKSDVQARRGAETAHDGPWQRLGTHLVRRWRTSCRYLGPWFRPNLWDIEPVSRTFGFDRGLPIDRYYIEHFLRSEAACIRGRVLEIEHDIYTRKFGGTGVLRSDILYRHPGHSSATIIADLADAPHIPDDSFDCIILIHTLQYIYDAAAAIRTVQRILKPGGAVLAAVPFTMQYSPGDRERWGEYWRFSEMAVERLFGGVFGCANTRVRAYGNALSVTAFLNGIAAHELSAAELDHYDSCYDLIVVAKAVKSIARL